MPTLKRNSPCSILALRGVVRKGTESASSLWLLSVACCSIIKHSHDSNRAISCERGVAIVANCAYPLRYLASRFSARCHACQSHLLPFIDFHQFLSLPECGHPAFPVFYDDLELGLLMSFPFHFFENGLDTSVLSCCDDFLLS